MASSFAATVMASRRIWAAEEHSIQKPGIHLNTVRNLLSQDPEIHILFK